MKLQLLKKDLKLFLSFLFVVIGFSLANGQTKTWDGSSSGNWNTAANWTPSGVPSATDDVVIPNGGTSTITVNTAAVCKTFTMNSGSRANKVQISTGNSLTVTGEVLIDVGTGNDDYKTLDVTTGVLTCGSLNLQQASNSNRVARLLVSTGTVTVGGDILMEGSRSTITFSNSGILNVAGNFESGGVFEESTCTVNYNGNGAQNIGAYTYNNLTTSASGVKTLPSGSAINGTVRIEGTSTLLAGNTNLILNTAPVILNGGTYSTGTTTGFTEQIGVLTLNENSVITLGTGNHTLTFASSSGASWASGKKLTITGWVGGYNGTGASGSNPKLFFGTAATHLTTSQKAQIRFFDGTNYYSSTQLSTGQVVPTGTELPGITGFSPSSLCASGSITLTGTGFAGVTAVRVNGVNVASYTVNSTTSITAVLAASNTTGDITVVMASGTYSTATNLIVNPKPTSVTSSASASPICIGGSVNLTSSATSNSGPVPVTLLDENFNGATNSWTKINNSTGGTVANSAWTLRPNNYSSGSQYGAVLSSNDSSQFYLSDSDMQGSAGTTNTILQSPSFSTVGLSDASFSFYHYFRFYQGSVTVDVSTNGSSWTTLATYTSDQGGAASFQQVTFSLNSYLSQPTVYVRFKYDSAWGYYWAIDNVLVTGVYVSAPATYAWASTPSGYTSAIQNPTGVSSMATSTYTVTVTNGYGCTASATTSSVVVDPTTVGGTVSGGASVCSGSTSGLLTLSGNTGTIVRWESSVSPFSTWTTIANTNATYTSGALTQTTQFRAVVQSGVCATANSAPTTVTIDSTTWNGTAWSNGTPTSTTAAVMTGNYTSSSSISACSLTVTNSSTVLITSGDSVTLNGALTVDAGSSFTLENNANLLQNGSSNLNSGSITVKRNSSALKRQDYTLWSSPVAEQQLQSFSPGTLSNRFYSYDTAANLLSGISSPSTTNFATAQGYLIRIPNVFPTTPTVWTAGAFVGVPNNGNYTYTMTDGGSERRFNLVGNPYPSPIDISSFMSNPTNSANTTGTLYFWRKTNGSSSPAYCTWSRAGFVSNGDLQAIDPESIIQTAQGFFVEATGNGTDLVFDNTMRVDNHTNQFFRTTSTFERHRIWLNATGANGLFSQTMVGYMTNATNGYDAGIDGRYINDGAIAFTSLIENETSTYAIQGRSLPFDAADVVPMQFKATTAGTYAIALDHVDGLFSGAQDIFLRDAQTGVDHNIKSGAYTFSTEAGTFATRFSVVYSAALSVDTPTLNANSIVIYKNENQSFTVNSGSVTMDTIKVFDVRGRLLTTQDNINATQASITAGQANQVLLVQITSIDGASVTKKVVR